METTRTLPYVDVIVPVYNAQETIVDCLGSLVKQDYPPERFTVIVCDDGSTDATPGLIARFPVVLLRQGNAGPAAARNAALRAAKGEIVLFLDADCVVEKDWIRSHVAAHEDAGRRGRRPGCVGGSIRPDLRGARFIEICDYYSSWYYPPRSAQDRAEYEYLPTTNLSMRRALLAEVGGLDESLRSGEDIALGMRLRERGAAIIKVPGIACYHRGRRTFTDYLRHHYHWGTFAPSCRPCGSAARYGFLFPRQGILSLLLAPLIAVGYTFYVIGKWSPERPFLVLALSPAIFVSKVAYACGVVRGTFGLQRKEQKR
jgi:GT2 family glycosyltransferase